MFRVNATEKFVLSDGYIYSPDAVEFNAGLELVSAAMHSIHFRNNSVAINKNEAIRSL